MTVWQKTLLTIGGLAASAALTTPAEVYAQGEVMVTLEILRRGGGRFAGAVGSGARLAGALHPLEALVFPCPAGCHDASRDCIEKADDAARTCITGACATQIEAAQTACIVRDDACSAAWATLRECATTCLGEHTTALTSCNDELMTCVDDCSADE